MDEQYTYVGNNRAYIIKLVSRTTRNIVGYDAAFDKHTQRIQSTVDSAPKADYYYSDAYFGYKDICYEGFHLSLNNKSQTYTVEGVNSDLRKYIPALARRSKCFFRSLKTIKYVLAIFVHAFNKFNIHKLLFPDLKASFYLVNFI